jgi:hypothetical protein
VRANGSKTERTLGLFMAKSFELVGMIKLYHERKGRIVNGSVAHGD